MVARNRVMYLIREGICGEDPNVRKVDCRGTGVASGQSGRRSAVGRQAFDDGDNPRMLSDLSLS